MTRGMVATTVAALLLLGVPGTAVADPGTEERVQSRTASSTTAVRPDGVRTVTLYSGPVRMRRGAEWLPTDLTLVAGPDGVARPVAMEHDLALTPTGPAVSFAGGGSAALGWDGTLPAPTLAGNRATYAQAAPGYDLVVDATRVGFVASLRRAGAAAGPAPALALRGRAELVPDTGPAGVANTEAESAVSRVVAAAPPAGPAPVPFDTTVQTTVLRTDTSGDPDLRMGSYDGVVVARSYLVWDLTELAGENVTGATLNLHHDWSSSCRPRAWEVWSSPAVGSATRWANQPVADRSWATSTETRGHDAACAPGWAAVDVTELVRSWTAGAATNGTMQLRATDEADPLSWKRFGSAESPNAPRLEITLS